MPMFTRATALESCIDEIRVLDEGLAANAYGDASDEIEAAICHLETAVKILRAPEEE